MLFFRSTFFFGVLASSCGAWGQTPAPPDYEAEALRYFATELLPRDHPTYRKLSYSGHVLPERFTFQVTRPCFPTADSLLFEAGALVLRSRSTGKAAPLPPGRALKAVKRTGRNVPWLGVWDAFAWHDQRRVVPLCLSLRYHYSDYYFITLNPAGLVVSSCRVAHVQ